MINEEAKKITRFTDLTAWQEAYKLVLLIYKATKDFPKEELYSLADQMKRAATSVTSNIAEGFGRQSYKEKVQFYYLAKGSLTELENQVLISNGLNYIPKNLLTQTEEQLRITQQLLHGLIRKSKTFINP